MSELKHYGTPRHSGRYPWGSGENPYQRSKNFTSYVDQLRREGLSQVEIAKGLGMTTTELRRRTSLAKEEIKATEISEAVRLKDKGYTNTAIAERLGRNESYVRYLLQARESESFQITKATVDVLRSRLEETGMIDVGVGVERQLGISQTKLRTAVTTLEDEGYQLHEVYVKQLGTGKQTTVLVLAKGDIDYQYIYDHKDEIKPVHAYSDDGGLTYKRIQPPQSISSDRIMVRYAEDGGTEKDGLIELRRGVEDLYMGNSTYCQVRVAVDGTHYMKGMAVYSDDLPDGVDVVYNSNKKRGSTKDQVFKKMKEDPENPFGASIERQVEYEGSDGQKHLSAINIVNSEGTWAGWSKKLSAQMLSKQSPELAKRQLDLTYDIMRSEYDEIMSLTNPVVKQKLLEAFADKCDSASVHLKAAGMPRQATQVLIPIPEMSDKEVYAPNFRNGETVVLIRYPHAGTFEIPELRVNNNVPAAKKVLGDHPKDAIGVNSKVAEQLSGADFDGDFVLVIPNNGRSVKSRPALEGLKGFDPKAAYPYQEGMPVMSERYKQIQMGVISNLITDMTIKGATDDELARADRHSMVVIDAVKHKLNYQESYSQNGILDLKKKYQGGGGVSTLLSRAGSEIDVPKRGRQYVDPETGEKRFVLTGATKRDKRTGEIVPVTQKSTRMYETSDAFTLSSGTTMENIYADYANRVKALANQTRKNAISIETTPYSPAARSVYSQEVASLKTKLNEALKNAPLERQAMILANANVAAKKRDNPDMSRDEIKKVEGQALKDARSRVGAKKDIIDITDREWEAIQSGAITKTTLKQILDNASLDQIRERALPKTETGLSTAKLSRAKAMLASGYTQADIAYALGVSVSTLNKALS